MLYLWTFKNCSYYNLFVNINYNYDFSTITNGQKIGNMEIYVFSKQENYMSNMKETKSEKKNLGKKKILKKKILEKKILEKKNIGEKKI